VAIKLGRKKIAARERLSEPITIVVSKSWKKRLEDEAAQAGFRSLAAFLRKERLGITD
jgi:hypothetical protein